MVTEWSANFTTLELRGAVSLTLPLDHLHLANCFTEWSWLAVGQIVVGGVGSSVAFAVLRKVYGWGLPKALQAVAALRRRARGEPDLERGDA